MNEHQHETTSGRRAFIICPFGIKKDASGKKINFGNTLTKLIEPALKATAFGGGTTGNIWDSGNIREDMFRLLLNADLAICDVTIHNANVFYELGIRQAFRKRRTILLKGTPSADHTPFDISTDRYLTYPVDQPEDALPDLIETIKSTWASDRESDSPIFSLLPDLKEQEKLWEVPQDFREDVQRAHSSKWKGWLRLLSDEVLTRSFSWEGLRLVAKAQWDIKDYEAAGKNWEKIWDADKHDIQANEALANIYERLSSNPKDIEYLKKSDLAIERILRNEKITPAQKVEALTLKGRNKKTRWRKDFRNGKTEEERRSKAMSKALNESLEAYLKAFHQDLNHFYPGLAALQMGRIFLDLAERDDTWMDNFDDDEKADEYHKKLEKKVANLEILVEESVHAELDRMTSTDKMWARISKADLLFLTGDRSMRIARAYKNAIPAGKLFAWDSARKQLELFMSLGIKAALAGEVIAEVDKKFTAAPEAAGQAVQLILFAGHRIDSPDSAEPHFSPAKEALIREKIKEKIQEIRAADHTVLGMASGAPGADILFHEVCAELGVGSEIFLPMDKDLYGRTAFKALDHWRNRFIKLIETLPTHQLSDRSGLPNWLHGANRDPWERGNHWIFQIASTVDAGKFDFLALLDEQKPGDAPGGPAHMLDLVSKSLKFSVTKINPKYI